MPTTVLTQEQIDRTLRVALHWRAVGNTLCAKLRLAALRKQLRGAQRDALDLALRKHNFLAQVLEADQPTAERSPFGSMPGGKHADGPRGWA
jgi:hypothetical protein